MRFFELSPEVSAFGWGDNSVVDQSVHPPIVSYLHYKFDGWLGDDLVETFPCFLVTSRLSAGLRRQPLTGYELRNVDISTTEIFKELQPSIQLPAFDWLYITGRAGSDDFGTTERGDLVVSENALQVLKSATLNHCEVSEYP